MKISNYCMPDTSGRFGFIRPYRLLRNIALVLVCSLSVDAANMADSVHLWHQEGEAGGGGDLIAMDARVEVTQIYTYYCALGWNTGYMGLQRGGGGGGFYKHVHFSIWDSPDGTPVEVVWKANEVVAERFGGEGTGYKTMYPYNWLENTTYRFCVRLEHRNGGTDYKAYFYAPEVGVWKHLVTIRRNDAQYTFGYVYSFVEDFVGSADLRRSCLYGNGWMRTTNGTWIAQRSALFTNYQHPYSVLNHDADVVGSMFRLETGGDTVRDTAINSFLQIEAQGIPPNIVPDSPTGVSASDGTSESLVHVSWNSSSGATTYEVWRNTTNSSNSASKIGETTSSAYFDNSVSAGIGYHYWIKAKNEIETSAFSSSDTGYSLAKIVMERPEILPNGQVVLRWNTFPGWVYTLRRSGDLKSWTTNGMGISGGSFTNAMEADAKSFWSVFGKAP